MSTMTAVAARRMIRRPSRQSPLGLVLFGVTLLLVIPPVGYLIYGSIRSEPPGITGGHLTLANLRNAFASSSVVHPLVNTLLISISVTAIAICVGFALAWLVTRTPVYAPRFWENALSAPLFLAPLFLTLAATALFGPGGYAGALFEKIGLGSGPNAYSWGGIVAVLSVYSSGYAFVSLLGPMQAVSAELEDAAAILGASRWRVLRTVLLRLLAPSAGSAAALIFALTAENFTVPGVLGGAHVPTISTNIYYALTYEPPEPNQAAAYGLLLLVVASIGLLASRRLSRHASRYVLVAGKPKQPKARSVTARRRITTTSVLAVFFTIAVLIPFATLIFASLQRYVHPGVDRLSLSNYSSAFSAANLAAVRHTLALAVIGAVLVCILGTLISYVLRRMQGATGTALAYVASMTTAIPGMALGVGLLWVYVSVPIGLYGTLGALLVGYVTRWLGLGVRIIGANMDAIDDELEAAARIAGAGTWRRLRTILAPLAGRGLVSAWLVLFVFITNELPVTILLYSVHSETMSIAIWNDLSMRGMSQAAVFSIVLGAVALVVVTALHFLGGRGRRGSDALKGGLNG